VTRPKGWPIAVRTVELREPLRRIDDVVEYSRTRVFVHDDGRLIGSVDIRNARGPISVTRLRDAITSNLAYPLMQHAVARQLQPSAPPPALDDAVTVSIVIATCGRPDDLRRCLMAVQAQALRRRVEVVVVDNRPGETATPQVAREFPNVVLIEEGRAGLSYARNAGFSAATGDILVAIDDDVTVPAGWLERLVAPFARPEVMAVTGHVLPLELETEAQCWFEAYGGLGKGFTPIESGGEWFRAHRGAVPTWQLGATANAAFRATAFQAPEIGLLDEALGPGTPTGVGEDTYLFYRILKAGYTILYEPAAWVWHRHRRDRESLKDQIYSYSKGHVAYHLTTWLRDGDRRAFVRLAYSLPKVYGWRAYSRIRGRSEYPLHLLITEIAGNLAGPWGLWRSRRRVRRLGRSAPVRRQAVSIERPLTQSSAP
jgi:O-antigen biosynthesis protein